MYFGRFIKLSSKIFPQNEISSDLSVDLQINSDWKHFLSFWNELSRVFYKELFKKIKKAENESKIHAKNQSKFLVLEYYIEKSSKE